jgi:hypothetical protein
MNDETDEPSTPRFLSRILRGDEEPAIMGRLRRLHEANRLGYHSFEDKDGWVSCPYNKTLGFLEANAINLTQQLGQGQAALFSLSLLPSPDSGKFIKPYDISCPGYLVDLSSEQTDPTRVVRIFPRNGNTGDNHYNKNLRMGSKTYIAYIDSLYGGHDALSIQQAVANDITLSETQLDALAAYYMSLQNDAAHGLLGHNELLAAISKKDIAAIVAPVYNDSVGRDGEIPRLVSQLRGALSGLEHLKKGMDLPIVHYHVTPPNQGGFTYLGQGEEKCRLLALDAIIKLQKDPIIKKAMKNSDPQNYWGAEIEWLMEQVKNTLDIKMQAPLKPDTFENKGLK